jgi:glycosyltransferase involved in cell wall biosynthesis
LASDIFRIVSNHWHGSRAFHEMGGKVDLVYERFGVFQSLGMLFRRSGIPWILETNTPFALENEWEASRRTTFFRRAAKKHEWQAYRSCDALVVQTSALKEIVLRFAEISPDKVFVVPNAVELNRYIDVPPIRKFAGPTIGFVGALRRWQALENLIHALGNVSREGILYNLLIVGDGEKKREWQKLALEQSLSDRVFFTGSIPSDQIPAWIAGFDLGFCGQARTVAAQRMYFSPLKLYEYMAAAKPVLASAHEDSLRLIAPGETGYLFEPDSTPALEHALRQAWHERDSWPVMGAQARRTIAAGHTWDIRIGNMIVPMLNFLQTRGFRAPR